MSNVFVLCSGRTASTSFSNACTHIDNYTAAHESRVGMLGQERVNYPDWHIEVDNRLAWFLPRLDNKYGDKAFYVYLTRNYEEIAASYLERWQLNESIVKAYGHGLLMKKSISKSERYAICLDYVHTVEENIQQFLAYKSNVLKIDVTELATKFGDFYDLIGARGDKQACMESIKTISNKNKTNLIKKLRNKILY